MLPVDDDRLVMQDPRPNRADAVKNRELLLQTAARLFAANGVEAVTMSEVAQAAGVGKGTLYRHFANKTDLCHALLDEDQRDLQNRSLRRMREHFTPMDNLEWFLEQVAHFVSRNLSMLCVVDESAPATLDNHAHIWWRLTIRGLLNRMQLDGDVDYIADTLYVMVDVNTIRFQMQTLRYDLPRIITGLRTTLHKLTR